MTNTNPIDEICQIESNDSLHEHGGAHGNKGNDFARFWLINELISLQKNGISDYLYLLEYVQDIARFDVEDKPSSVILYQLKKKDNSTWTHSNLTGITSKKLSIDQKLPIPKLLSSVLSFKELNASAEFVSNARFSVKLATENASTSLDYLPLSDMCTQHKAIIETDIATLHNIGIEAVPMNKVALRHAAIEVDDMRNHIIGIAYMFLKEISLEHAGQAESFVDALFVKLASASRHTSKCLTWNELVTKRGYGKKQFEKDLMALKALPDQHNQRIKLLEELREIFKWHVRDVLKIEIALNELLTTKLSTGSIQMYKFNSVQLDTINAKALEYKWSVEKEFNEVLDFLSKELPDETISKIQALTIYLMVDAWTNQIYA